MATRSTCSHYTLLLRGLPFKTRKLVFLLVCSSSCLLNYTFIHFFLYKFHGVFSQSVPQSIYSRICRPAYPIDVLFLYPSSSLQRPLSILITSIDLSVNLSSCLPFYLSIYLSIHPFIYLSIYLPIYLSIFTAMKATLQI